jgi:hypothetical protein
MAALPGKIERVLGDPYRRRARDHFQAGNHVLHDLVLKARVQIFGVLAKDHHVDGDVVETGLQSRKRMHRTDVGEQIELLSQGHVDALKSAGNWGGHGTFEPHMGTL